MDFDFSNIKPTVISALIVLMIVLVTVPLAKFVFNRYPVPGLTDLVNAV